MTKRLTPAPTAEGSRTLRVGVDVPPQFARQIRRRREDAARQHIPLNLREPQLNLIQPRRIRASRCGRRSGLPPDALYDVLVHAEVGREAAARPVRRPVRQGVGVWRPARGHAGAPSNFHHGPAPVTVRQALHAVLQELPAPFCRRQLDVRLTARTVECFHRGQRVASHVRSPDKGRHTTAAEHMPEKHRRMGDWTHLAAIRMLSPAEARKLLETIRHGHPGRAPGPGVALGHALQLRAGERGPGDAAAGLFRDRRAGGAPAPLEGRETA